MTDIKKLIFLLQSLAVESSFERALLVLEYPTPFSNHDCLMLAHELKKWSGSVRDQTIASLYSCFSTSVDVLATKPWAMLDVPAVLREQLFLEFQDKLLGVAHRSVSEAGIIYHIVFFRRSGAVTISETKALSMKLVCIADLAKRVCSKFGLERFKGMEFTVREREVLRWTADGKSASEISAILAISENTVNYHIKKILAKTGSCGKFHAAAQAASYRIL
nr:helix-turn-helix transcriptional regulator [uncultured Pseudomonas sp.]